ncbi:hypothetical protein ACHAXM_008517 [Skeletonema potamos]
MHSMSSIHIALSQLSCGSHHGSTCKYAKDTHLLRETIAKKEEAFRAAYPSIFSYSIHNNPIHIFASNHPTAEQQYLVTMSDPTIEAKDPSNDIIELFWFSSTDATPSESTTTTEATTTAEATTTTEVTEVPTTTSTAAVVTEVSTTTTASTDTTTEETTTEATSTTTTVPPQMTKEIEIVVDTEQTIDWSTFAVELKKKIEESDGKEETSNKSKSYFSCSPPATADDGSNSPPGKAIVLKYDYDLTTAANLNDNTLSVLEDDITKNLAENYGLAACRRRYLRGLETDVVILALDSKPADFSVADTTKCAEQVVDTTSPNSSCTPISGSMTIYVEHHTDVETAKAKILSHIMDGMASGAYTDDNVIKTSYVGSRHVVASGDVADVPSINMAGDVVDVNDIVPLTNVPVINEIQASPLSEKEPPTLTIGISVFLLCFSALVLGYVLFVNRRKKDPSDESTQQRDDAKIVPDMKKVESAESTVDLTEKETSHLSDDKYGNAVASNTLSSSGDEDDLQYGVTEDYGDLAVQDVTQVHPESCSADLESRLFETRTPITTPITSPVSSPRKLLPRFLSPATSVEEDLLADVDDIGGTMLGNIPI